MVEGSPTTTLFVRIMLSDDCPASMMIRRVRQIGGSVHRPDRVRLREPANVRCGFRPASARFSGSRAIVLSGLHRCSPCRARRVVHLFSGAFAGILHLDGSLDGVGQAIFIAVGREILVDKRRVGETVSEGVERRGRGEYIVAARSVVTARIVVEASVGGEVVVVDGQMAGASGEGEGRRPEGFTRPNRMSAMEFPACSPAYHCTCMVGRLFFSTRWQTVARYQYENDGVPVSYTARMSWVWAPVRFRSLRSKPSPQVEFL